MNKHTPGPWIADEAGRVGFTVFSPEAGYIIGCHDDEGRYGAIDSEANARLIAAAPDLLDALQSLLKGIFDGPDEAHAAMLVAKGRDAINKATRGNP